MIEAVKFTEEVRQKYCDLLRSGTRRGQAAKACGITRATVMKHIRDNAEFEEAVIEAEQDSNEVIETVLYDLAKSGDFKAINKWLNNRDRYNWKDKQTVEVSGLDGAPIEINDLANLSNEELKERLRVLKES